jgi:hypothetical protein
VTPANFLRLVFCFFLFFHFLYSPRFDSKFS